MKTKEHKNSSKQGQESEFQTAKPSKHRGQEKVEQENKNDLQNGLYDTSSLAVETRRRRDTL